MKENKLLKWIPALIVMSIIFLFSSQPSKNLPDFGLVDRLVKKGGHMLGYGLLAISCWFGFDWERKKRPIAWLFAVLYAMTDEFHQSFVAGRYPSMWDVVIFDNFGALISLWLTGLFVKQKRPDKNA
jgi:VanZ family protein